MTYDEALRKAINCLKLSQSPNQHEAALAASKAQEIIDRYRISIEDINQGNEARGNDEPIVDFGEKEPLQDVCGVDTRWTLSLAVSISRQNACRIYYTTKITSSSTIKIVGRTSDVQTVRYIFGWLEKEVRRITRQECSGYPRKYQAEFRMGVVDTIRRKLEEQKQETYKNVQNEAVNPMALVRVQQSIARMEANGEAVDNWMKLNMSLKEARSRERQTNLSARWHGQLAGNQIQITQAKASIGSPRGQLVEA